MLICHLFENIDLDKTAAKYGEALLDRAAAIYDLRFTQANRPTQDDGKRAVQQFINADPSIHKSYVQWMIRLYLNGGINYFEDLGRAREALVLFDRFKQRLPVEQRDINRVKTLPDLEDIVVPFENLQSNKQLKKDELDKIKAETEVIYDGDAGKILIPKTEEASCFWGQQTRWCTAGNHDNYFEHYNHQGPLYIIILKNGDKYQFHFESGQLMNAADREVDFKNFDRRYPWVFDRIGIPEEEQRAAILKDPSVIKFIQNPSEDIQKLVVSRDGLYIRYIENPSEEIKRIAVEENEKAIQYIENPNEELQEIVVSMSPRAIRYIVNPSEYIQKLVLQLDPRCIQYIANPSEAIQKFAVDVFKRDNP